MPADVSAYATLGLEPDADAAAIDRAYRDLIKRYHPDRDGGDLRRAAEITRAYRELKTPAVREDLILNDLDVVAEPRFTWAGAALATVGAALILLLAAGPISRQMEVPRLPLGLTEVPARTADIMSSPLAGGAISASVAESARLARSSDEMALATASRNCHHQLRLSPSLEALDRCIAFDDAVVLLQDRDPLRDQGPFSEIAVTGRQWSAAQALSNDNLAIDSRLDRIRLEVELALSPPPEPAAPVQD
jgi:hypothetical protein